MLNNSVVSKAEGFVFLASPPRASHPVEVLREVLATLPGADVALVQAGAAVEDGWYDALHAAAYVDSTTATASAVRARTTDRTFPRWDRRRHRDGAGASDRKAGVGVRVPAPRCHRARVGLASRRRLRVSLSDYRGRRVDHDAGLVHRIAPTSTLRRRTSVLRIDGASGSAGLRRLLDVVEARGDRLRVMIDLRCCAYPMSGTQVQALQLVRALSRLDQADVAVLLPEAIHPSVSREVSGLPSNVRRHTTASLPSRRPHVFHCPYLLVDQQIGEAVTLGDRLVITTSGHDHEPYAELLP